MSRTAVVMLNWNRIEHTRRALESLLLLPAPPRIYVVDNHSLDDEGARLAAEYPGVVVETLSENVGFARAVNRGAERAMRDGATYLLLFNNDAWFEPGSPTLDLLEHELDARPDVGAAGPRILNPDRTVQSNGYVYSLWFPIARACSGPRSVPNFLSGSCLLIRGETFLRLQGMDPDFFLYGDDVDFAIRMRALGQTIARVAAGEVYHERAAANRLYSSNYSYTALRSSLINVKKHASSLQYPTAYATLLLASLALSALGARAGERRAPAAVVKAWIDFFRGRWGGYDGSPLRPTTRPC